MTATRKSTRKSQKPLIVAIVLLTLIIFMIVITAVINSSSTSGTGSIDAQSYATEVAAALAGADKDLGAKLVEDLDCAVCHLEGDGSLAPLFPGVADFASVRRPPLSGEQYLYEAILFPAVHLVDGYTNAMPNNYEERLSQQDVGHIIAYLLSFSSDQGGS